MHAENNELLSLYLAGDPGAGESVVSRHAGLVSRVCERICQPDSDLAKECAQETWLQVFKVLGNLRDSGNLTSFLCKIATNVSRNEILHRNTSRIGNEISATENSQTGEDIDSDSDLHF